MLLGILVCIQLVLAIALICIFLYRKAALAWVAWVVLLLIQFSFGWFVFFSV